MLMQQEWPLYHVLVNTTANDHPVGLHTNTLSTLGIPRRFASALTQVGDMRKGWKKMKAAGINSDEGLRYHHQAMPVCVSI